MFFIFRACGSWRVVKFCDGWWNRQVKVVGHFDEKLTNFSSFLTAFSGLHRLGLVLSTVFGSETEAPCGWDVATRP